MEWMSKLVETDLKVTQRHATFCACRGESASLSFSANLNHVLGHSHFSQRIKLNTVYREQFHKKNPYSVCAD